MAANKTLAELKQCGMALKRAVFVDQIRRGQSVIIQGYSVLRGTCKLSSASYGILFGACRL